MSKEAQPIRGPNVDNNIFVDTHYVIPGAFIGAAGFFDFIGFVIYLRNEEKGVPTTTWICYIISLILYIIGGVLYYRVYHAQNKTRAEQEAIGRTKIPKK